MYVSTFEALLRNECGFDRPLPWWDETLDAGRINESSIFTAGYLPLHEPLENGFRPEP